MLEMFGDKVLGFFTYWVLLFDPLKLRTAAGQAIAAAYQSGRNGIASTRAAIGRAISGPMASFMEAYAYTLGVIAFLASVLRFATNANFFDGWVSFALFSAVTIGSIVVIMASARKQRLNGTEVITGWQDAAGNRVPVDAAGNPIGESAEPVFGPDYHPFRVSFFRSGALLSVATCAVGTMLFADAMVTENRWLIVPVLIIFSVGLVVVKVVTAVASWVIRRSILTLESAGEIALHPLAALPGLYFDSLRTQLFDGGRLNLFDEQTNAEHVDRVVPAVYRVVMPFLLISYLFGADQFWTLITGVVVVGVVFLGIALLQEGDDASVDLVTQRRRRFLATFFIAFPWLAIVSVGGWRLLPDARWKAGLKFQANVFYDYVTAVLFGRQSIVTVRCWYEYVGLLLVTLAMLLVAAWVWKKTSALTGYFRVVVQLMTAFVMLFVFVGLLNSMGFLGTQNNGIALATSTTVDYCDFTDGSCARKGIARDAVLQASRARKASIAEAAPTPAPSSSAAAPVAPKRTEAAPARSNRARLAVIDAEIDRL